MLANLKGRLLPAIVACAAIAFAGGPARAYSVAPLRLVLEPAGGGATGRIEIRNNDARPVTLSLVAETAVPDRAGQIAAAPADEELLVFPPQLIVAPGGSQTVQVRFMGDPRLDSARLFTVRVEQEPVDMTGSGQAQLKVGVNFVTAVLVQPKGATAVATVTGFRPVAGGVQVDLRNDGRGALRIPALAFRIESPGGAVAKQAGALRDYGGTGFLLPGGSRSVLVPLETVPAAISGVTVGAAQD